ncbi:MAG: DUF805 domain-containing protein [Erythrobacter sp.]|nr:DUF805 domain-containing protein [Erythrobacter sp.]
MDWMFVPLRRYADFSGRSRRKEYWWFVLFQWAVYALVVTVDQLWNDPAAEELLLPTKVVLGAAMAFFAIPTLAVQVRRMHDRGRSGWWLLIGFAPYFGLLYLVLYMLLPGTVGPNEYGPDPRLRPGSRDPHAADRARYGGWI